MWIIVHEIEVRFIIFYKKPLFYKKDIMAKYFLII
jgi:hypothetical protein